MATNNRNVPIIRDVDKETIRTLASLSFEKQTFVKGIILGLYNQLPSPSAAQHTQDRPVPNRDSA